MQQTSETCTKLFSQVTYIIVLHHLVILYRLQYVFAFLFVTAFESSKVWSEEDKDVAPVNT